MRQPFPRSVWRALSAFTLLFTTASSVLANTDLPVTPQPVTGQAASFKIFLPLSLKSDTTPPPPPPPSPPTGGIFLDRTVKTASAATTIDANGGYHAAYVHYVPEVEKPQAVYGYCTGTACNNKANWREVKLAENPREVQLAVTPLGQPRLLIVTSSTLYTGGKDYHYAECDTNCTDRAGWTITRTFSSWGTTTSDILNDRLPQRSFALDPQGRPRFIYQDRNYFYKEPDHYGAFYAYCDANCTNAQNWYETEVGRNIKYDAEIFDTPSLTFTSSGQPRVFGRVFSINYDGQGAESGLFYYECDSACDQQNNWKRVFLMPTGSGSYPHPAWDIELDANNLPRAVIFTGGGELGDAYQKRLLYLWCDQNCLERKNWFFNSLGMDASDGQSPDLELDVQGRPRIAWIDSSGDLGYSSCNTGCHSDTPQWQNKIVETEAALRREFPQAIPFNCDADVWEGLAPVLDLDSGGNPRIAYDASVEARCLYDDPNDNQPPYHRFMPVWRAAKLTYFTQP